MKTFLGFLPAAVLAITLLPCEGRVRRQIWPAPNDPNFYFEDQGDDRDFFDGNFWPGPPRISRPDRLDQSQDFDQPSRFEQSLDYNQPSRFEDDFRDDFSFGGDRNDRNQNRRTTTESTGPMASTPRTIHVAPQGCNCPMTQQFNPVCGTDGNTYRNKGLLNCYTRCGSNVSQKRLGRC